MARKRMVTRTIESTKVTTLALDVTTSEPCNRTYNLSGVYDNEAKLLKAVQKAYDTDTLKNVHVVSNEKVETIYGMDENQFLALAVELDPVTRKPIAKDGTEDDSNTAEDAE